MSKYGFFTGIPVTEWLINPGGPDREMILREDFQFTDPDGREWLAPQGSTINGASIPRALWSVLGSPYTDDYRCASIVHDVAYSDPQISHKDADKMFYYACMAGGCKASQAALLYAGVRLGSWAVSTVIWGRFRMPNLLYRLPGDVTSNEQKIINKYNDIAAEIKKRGEEPTFEELDALIDEKLGLP